MDGDRFDALVCTFTRGAGRRAVLGAILGGALAGLARVAGPGATGRERDAGRGGPPPDVAAEKKPKKKTICHQGTTIKVAKKAVKKHLAHGDILGPCPPPPPDAVCSETAFQQCKAPAWVQAVEDAEVCRAACETDEESEACQDCLRPIAEGVAAASISCGEQACRGGLADVGSREAPRRADRITAAADSCNATKYQDCRNDLIFSDMVCNAKALVKCLKGVDIGCLADQAACDALLVKGLLRCKRDNPGCFCEDGLVLCGGQCVDVNLNCGECGRACTGVRSCRGGSCKCPTEMVECGGQCASIHENCGGCGNACNPCDRCENVGGPFGGSPQCVEIPCEQPCHVCDRGSGVGTCAPVKTCGNNQLLNPANCKCECQVSCPAGLEPNPENDCACECPGGGQPCEGSCCAPDEYCVRVVPNTCAVGWAMFYQGDDVYCPTEPESKPVETPFCGKKARAITPNPDDPSGASNHCPNPPATYPIYCPEGMVLCRNKFGATSCWLPGGDEISRFAGCVHDPGDGTCYGLTPDVPLFRYYSGVIEWLNETRQPPTDCGFNTYARECR
jgi:hypothetical protein